METVLFSLLGAFLNRVRGGLFGPERGLFIKIKSTFLGRAIVSTGFGGGAALIHSDWYLLALIPALFVGLLPNWEDVIDRKSWLFGVFRGVVLVLPSAYVFFAINTFVGTDYQWSAGLLIYVGLALPLIYRIGWWVPSKVKGLEQGPEVAEALLGALLFAAVSYNG